eukprot:457908-Rhodomonas_salina.1
MAMASVASTSRCVRPSAALLASCTFFPSSMISSARNPSQRDRVRSASQRAASPSTCAPCVDVLPVLVPGPPRLLCEVLLCEFHVLNQVAQRFVMVVSFLLGT